MTRSVQIDDQVSELLRRLKLGEHITNHFLVAKRQEWEEYISQVSPWELDSYLAKY